MVQILSQPEAKAYLRKHGCSTKEITSTLNGFVLDDRTRPIYLQPLEIGKTLFNFAHTPSVEHPVPGVGYWFCLAGATKQTVAAQDTVAPRVLKQFVVVRDVFALEGIAKEMSGEHANYEAGIFGPGGATQIYLPPSLRDAVAFVGQDVDGRGRVAGDLR